MDTTSIRPCTCKHEYQDKVYGAGKRLHNISPKHGWRCTVCKDIKPDPTVTRAATVATTPAS